MSEIVIKYGNFTFTSLSGYPTPNLTVSTDQIRTPAGDYLMSEKTITLDGVCYAAKKTIHNHIGPLSSSQEDISINGLFLLASGLQTRILQNNHSGLHIFLANATSASDNYLIKNNAIVDSIVFNENDNSWRNTIDYTITLKIYDSGTGSYLTSGFGNYVTSVTDTYNLQLMDTNNYLYQDRYVPVYKLTRTIGAVGKRIHPVTGALYHAKMWVYNREKTAPLTGMFRPSDFILYNQEREVSVDEPGGSYTIIDNFIAKSGDPWLETYTINTSIDNQFNRKISINGSIQGLEPASGVYTSESMNLNTDQATNALPSRSGQLDIYPTATGLQGYITNNGRTNFATFTNIGKNKYMNAVDGYNILRERIFNRALSYNNSTINLIDSAWNGSSVFPNYRNRPLNPIPLSLTESMFPFEGKITYQAEYDSRPISIITGAISETCSFTEKLPTKRVQEIQILGRRLGPLVYEYYGSVGIGSRTVSYEAVFPRESGLKGYSFPQRILNAVDTMLLQFKPLPPFTGYLREDTQQIVLTENKLVCVKSWDYTKCSDI